jgi:hypothetical protein
MNGQKQDQQQPPMMSEQSLKIAKEIDFVYFSYKRVDIELHKASAHEKYRYHIHV